MTIFLPPPPVMAAGNKMCGVSLAAGSFWTRNQSRAAADSLVGGRGGRAGEHRLKLVITNLLKGNVVMPDKISHTAAATTTVAHTQPVLGSNKLHLALLCNSFISRNNVTISYISQKM